MSDRSTIRATVPGKAILAGEHFVLHGVPALAAPVFSRTMTVALRAEPAGTFTLVCTAPDLPPGTAAALTEPVAAALGTSLAARVAFDVDSTLPTGAGLGSSAALGVGLGRALALHMADAPVSSSSGPLPDPAAEDLARRIAHAVDGHFHGRASGTDTAVIASGCTIRLDPAADGPRVTPVEVAVPVRFLLIDSGVRRRTDGQIARVAAQRKADPAAFAVSADEARAATLAMIDALGHGDADAIHTSVATLGRLLAALGLEPPGTDAIRAAIEPLGLALKVTGAGGGGYLLACAPDPVALDRAIAKLAPREAFTFDLHPRAAQEAADGD